MLRRITLGLAAAILWTAASAGTASAQVGGPFCIRTTDDATGNTTDYRFNLLLVTAPDDFPGEMYLVYAAHGVRLADLTADLLPVSGTMFIRFLTDAIVVRLRFSDGLDSNGEEETMIIDFVGLERGTFLTERADEIFSGPAELVACGPLPAS